MPHAVSGVPSWESAPDEEIIRRVQQGEAKLFSVIFERHYARLESFVRRLGVPERDLEDVLAETFTRAFARVRSFNPDSGARYGSYLYAIARNHVTDRFRTQARAPVTSLLDDLWSEADPDAAQPMDEVLRHEQVDQIRDGLARLSATDREIITLSYDRELSCREIMQVMGKPSVTAVTTHLYKAMKRLREHVLAEDACGAGR